VNYPFQTILKLIVGFTQVVKFISVADRLLFEAVLCGENHIKCDTVFSCVSQRKPLNAQQHVRRTVMQPRTA